MGTAGGRGEEYAHYEPLTQAQRARATQLDAELRAFLEPDERAAIVPVKDRFMRIKLRNLGADPEAIDELADLNRLGQAFTVYLTPRRLRTRSTTAGAGARRRTAPASSA